MADWTDFIAPLIGGYMGYKAGGNQTATSQTQMDPDAKNQWLAYRDFANQVASRPYQNTVAPFTQDQYSAFDQIRNNAAGGPEQQAGSMALQNFLKGPEANPYLQGIIKQTNDQVMNRMNTGAFNSGSFGNSGVAKATADALAQNTNNVYQTGLNQTMQAIPQALNYQNQNMQNTNALLQGGAMQQQLGQRQIDNWWQYPQQQMSMMAAPLGLAKGETTTSTSPVNTWGSTLGGGLLGLQFGKLF